MMNIHNACATAGFMWEGVRPNDPLLEIWGQGCLELCQEVTQYALLSEMFLTAVFTVVEEEYPGVYDYEVSEPFGQWCRQEVLTTGSLDRHFATSALMGLVYDFFIVKCGKDHNTNLQAALEAVRQHWLETHK